MGCTFPAESVARAISTNLPGVCGVRQENRHNRHAKRAAFPSKVALFQVAPPSALISTLAISSSPVHAAPAIDTSLPAGKVALAMGRAMVDLTSNDVTGTK